MSKQIVRCACGGWVWKSRVDTEGCPVCKALKAR